MARPAVLLFNPDTRRKLVTGVRSLHPYVCETTTQLHAYLKTHVCDAVLLGLRDTVGETTVSTVQHVRLSYPRIWISTCLEWSESREQEIELALAAGRAGANDVLISGVDSWATIYERLRAVRCEQAVAARVLEAVGTDMRGDVRRFFEYGILHVRKTRKVAAVAERVGVSRQTLSRQCRKLGLLPPESLLSWARILVVSALLEQPGVTAEQAHRQFFGSSSELHNMLREYTKLRTTEVKARGGLEAVLPLFLRAIRSPSETVHVP